MPLPITFDWTEDEHLLSFVLHVKGAKAKHVDIALCSVYVKVNIHPSLFEADLFKEIDPDDPKTRCRVESHRVTLKLKKKEPGLWREFRAAGTKAELRERRRQALADAAAREEERQKKKEEWKIDMVKAGEHEQWRLDRENREQIEEWEKKEQQLWEEDMYKSFDDDTKTALAPPDLPLADGDLDAPDDVKAKHETVGAEDTDGGAVPLLATDERTQQLPVPAEADGAKRAAAIIPEATKRLAAPLIGPDNGSIWSEKDLDDTEEYVPEVRDNPGKIGMRFTERPRAGVPVRDRGQVRLPPHPKGTVKSDLPPMLEGDRQEDEQDPVWLKDKADNLMGAGDYQGAYNAYTEALKLATNARAFANRAVADLYLGNFEQCIEDCNHSLRILDLRTKSPAGHMPNPSDPQDQLVRARVETRMATAYLWLGAFGKAEEHFDKALTTEDGLDHEDKQVLKDDLERVRAAKAALVTKEKADSAVRHAAGGGDFEREALDAALGLYDEAANGALDTACIHANRCFTRLRARQLEPCLKDAEAALNSLRRWPVATRPPKKPPRPSRLDPPYLDDPTFKHPDEQKQGEVDWLMKHGGGTKDNLPPIPPEYEWVKDASEKDTWIAVRRKMTKSMIDTIKRNTTQLQDVVYTRNFRLIREQIPISLDTNKVGEGPSDRALRQADDYATKLEEHEKEREAERQQEEEELRQEVEECNLEQLLAPVRSGVAQTGFGRAHPVEKTRRRLFVKTLLRRASAYELLGDADAGAADLRVALKVEPDNLEAKKRLSILTYSPSPTAPEDVSHEVPPQAPSTASAAVANAPPGDGRVASTASSTATTVAGTETTAASAATAFAGVSVGGTTSDGRSARRDLGGIEADDVDEDDGETRGNDYASTAALVSSAAEYMKRSDYQSALQIYNYARRQCKDWESPVVELRVLSNTCLCLQRIRGRLPELVAACGDVMSRIDELRASAGQEGDLSEEKLLHMEAACLSRRGSALAQLRRCEESARDAARVKELMARVQQLEASKQ